ncbi:MAG: dienelactone hydrolase family protein [Deltaproteobacteria bacterium]|nr:dienelactone hydrolase family protein [Deltaproteobacteria bacterium]
MRAYTLLLAAALLTAACGGGPDDPSQQSRDPAVRGPWGVGVTTYTITDPADATRVFKVEVWYPATPTAGAPLDKVFNITTTSVRDAPADLRGAPFPAVAFSHGNCGIRTQSLYLTEHLASHGYVVVAPDHLLNTLWDNDPDFIADVMRHRPRDVSLALDEVLRHGAAAGDPLAGMADEARVGAAGHSFGGFTVLLLAGAAMDLQSYAADCAPTPDSLFCRGANGTITAADVAGFADARILATLSLAPGGRVAFGPAGLAELRGPIQVQAGTLDTMCPLETEAGPIYDGLPAPKVMAEFADAAHFSFTDICPLYDLMGGADGPLDFLATEGCGPNTVPVADAQAASRTLGVAFFDLHLRGLADEAGYLDPARGVAGVTLR